MSADILREDIKDSKWSEIKSKDVKRYECDVCERGFCRKSSLIEHKYIHSNRYPFECEICGKKFRQNSNFCKHQKLHRKADPKYKCEWCGRTFTTQSYLKSHSLSHYSLKNCLCDKCGHTFKHKSDLSRHLKIHENQRQFKCDVCLFGFNDRSTLRRHTLRAHHKTNTSAEERVTNNTNKSEKLNDSDYFHSVMDYINICRILPHPLPNHIFEKLIEMQKEIGLYLGVDSKCEKQKFSVLKTGLHDLNAIICEDLLFKYKTLN